MPSGGSSVSTAMGRFSLSSSSSESQVLQPEKDVFWAEELGEGETRALAQLRQSLVDEGLLKGRVDEDTLLLRFLKARGWDVTKALEMLKNNLKWREDNRADTILEWFQFPEREEVERFYPTCTHGVDVFGRPVYIEKLGRLDVDAMMKVTTFERMVQHHIHGWEHLNEVGYKAASEKAGRRVFTSMTILDLDGIGMKHFKEGARNYIKAISAMDQDNYPEHLGQMFIVNAPYVFKGIWSAIKPWLEARTQKKIQIMSTGHGKVLREVIGAENLPFWLGGECTCSECQRMDGA